MDAAEFRRQAELLRAAFAATLTPAEVAEVMQPYESFALMMEDNEAEDAQRVVPSGYVASGERVDIFTTDRTAACPHCGGPLIIPAPFRYVPEEEFVDLPCDPDDYPLV
jgi:hypothetical protein